MSKRRPDPGSLDAERAKGGATSRPGPAPHRRTPLQIDVEEADDPMTLDDLDGFVQAYVRHLLASEGPTWP